MGQDQTAVIDEKTTAVDTTSSSVGRTRWLAIAGAVVTVAAGSIVWITVGGNPASADRQASAAARSTGSAAESAVSPSDAAPSGSAAPAAAVPSAAGPSAIAAPSSSGTAGPSATAPKPSALPAGWEARTFQGVTFSVPPGAQTPDNTDPGNADAPATFTWNGPSLGGDLNSQVTVRISPAADAPAVGPEYQPLTVPGADQAHFRTGPTGTDPATVAVDLQILTGGRFVDVVAVFAAGPAGEQMVRDLIASVSIA